MSVPVARKPWTILVYSAGDNSLAKALVQNLHDCETVGSTDQVNIVSQLDVGGKVGANRIYVERDPRPGLHSPVVQKLGPTDMADPATLTDFIKWGMTNYPADHTMLIISDHGYGWRGVVDDKSGGTHLLGIPIWPHRMTVQGVQQALQTASQATGKKMDILGWDACLMASAEVAAQLKNDTNYMIASEETESDQGWPYTRIISPAMLRTADAEIRTRSQMTPRDFASLVVGAATADHGAIPTLAAYDMQKMPDLIGAVKSFSDALQRTPTANGVLRGLARHSQVFHVYKVLPYRDLYDFASRIQQSPQISDATLKAAAGTVMQAMQTAIFAEEHDPQYPGAHGMTVQLGTLFFSPSHKYRGLDFPQETGWDAALDRIGSWI